MIMVEAERTSNNDHIQWFSSVIDFGRRHGDFCYTVGFLDSSPQQCDKCP